MGIDNGGTATKAVIFDRTGRAVGSASRKVPMVLPEPGFTERDMDVLWTANCEAIREAIAAAGIDSRAVRGVACTGHGKGLYLWGRDGKPAYNGIVSTDARAWQYPQRWREDGTISRTFERTCQSILACQPVSLLRWLRDNRPGVVESTRWVFEVKDYIRFLLTGEAFAEATDYSGSGLMNVRDARFDRQLLEEFGLGDVYDLIPPLRYSTEICGTVTPAAAAATGLAAGTPVAGGMFDIDACAVAVDVTDEKNICVIAGTWSINEYVARAPVLDGSILMNSLFCIPGLYLVEESSPTSAGNYEWFTALFLEEEKAVARERGISLSSSRKRWPLPLLPTARRSSFFPTSSGRRTTRAPGVLRRPGGVAHALPGHQVRAGGNRAGAQGSRGEASRCPPGAGCGPPGRRRCPLAAVGADILRRAGAAGRDRGNRGAGNSRLRHGRRGCRWGVPGSQGGGSGDGAGPRPHPS